MEINPIIRKSLEKNENIIALYDWQISCLKLYQSITNNFICNMPTSGGKTLIAEIIMLEKLFEEKNVLFVLPYIAIVQEKIQKLTLYSDDFNFILEEYAGGKGVFPPKNRRRRASLYIATFEKANSLFDAFVTEHNGSLLTKLDVVVIDEIHMLGYESGTHRSAVLENLITKIMFYNKSCEMSNNRQQKCRKIRIVGMSATLPTRSNCGDLLQFMDATMFEASFRPIKLNEYVKNGQEIYEINEKSDSNNHDSVGKIVKKLHFLPIPTYYNKTLLSLDPDMLFYLSLPSTSFGEDLHCEKENGFVTASQVYDRKRMKLNDSLNENSFASESGSKRSIPTTSSCLIFCPTKNNAQVMANNLVHIYETLVKQYEKATKILARLSYQKRRKSNNHLVVHHNNTNSRLSSHYKKDNILGSTTHKKLNTSLSEQKQQHNITNQKNTPPSENGFTNDTTIHKSPKPNKYKNILTKRCYDELKMLPDHRLLLQTKVGDKISNDDNTKILAERRRLLMRELAQAQFNEFINPEEMENSDNMCPILKRCIPWGIAYHHGGLAYEERKLIEDAFSEGVLSILCCTTTLAAGVNLPANKVITASNKIANGIPLSQTMYTQMIGRAGRPNMLGNEKEDVKAETLLIITNYPKNINNTSFLSLPNTKNSCEFPLDQTSLNNLLSGENSNSHHSFRLTSALLIAETSNFDPKAKDSLVTYIKNLFLSVIETKLANTFPDMVLMLKCTFYSHQKRLLGTLNSDEDINRMVQDILNNMLDTNLIQKEIVKNGNSSFTRFILTKFGNAINKSYLDYNTGFRLYKDLSEAQNSLMVSTCLHLIFLITPYDLSIHVPDSDWKLALFKVSKFNAEHKILDILGINENLIIQKMMGSNMNKEMVAKEPIFNRFYWSLILYSLWQSSSIWQTAKEFGELNRSFVQHLYQSAIQFGNSILSFLQEFEEFWPIQCILPTFLKQFSNLFSKDLLPLIDLPGVKMGRIRQIYDAGYKNLYALANAKPESLVKDVKFMSHTLANQIVASARILIKEKIESLEEEKQAIIDNFCQQNENV